MNYYEKVPRIETNSFYQRYKMKAPRLEFAPAHEKREFAETYIEYIYDGDGNRTKVKRAYEDVV